MIKTVNFDDFTKERINKHNSNWQHILDHPYRILKNEGFGTGKINPLV